MTSVTHIGDTATVMTVHIVNKQAKDTAKWRLLDAVKPTSPDDDNGVYLRYRCLTSNLWSVYTRSSGRITNWATLSGRQQVLFNWATCERLTMCINLLTRLLWGRVTIRHSLGTIHMNNVNTFEKRFLGSGGLGRYHGSNERKVAEISNFVTQIALLNATDRAILWWKFKTTITWPQTGGRTLFNLSENITSKTP